MSARALVIPFFLIQRGASADSVQGHNEQYSSKILSDGCMLQVGTWNPERAGKRAPAPTPCEDSAGVALNRKNKGCEVYKHDPDDPWVGICFDPYYDDEDFTAGDMCCVCPSQCPAIRSIANQTCEDWIHFNEQGAHSNLGGKGPNSKLRELRFRGVTYTQDGTS